MTFVQVLNLISVYLSQALRIIGLAALGLTLGWLVLDLLKKAQTWYMEAILFLGLLGFVIAMVVFTGWGALGAFTIGLAVAIFLWGMPKKAKVEPTE
jgi:NhaP-type Na+/H+ or K+/H+ antiporter